jgi:hypothetical protein
MDLLLYEDEIRSVEGPDARRGGPDGTSPVYHQAKIRLQLQGSRR